MKTVILVALLCGACAVQAQRGRPGPRLARFVADSGSEQWLRTAAANIQAVLDGVAHAAMELFLAMFDLLEEALRAETEDYGDKEAILAVIDEVRAVASEHPEGEDPNITAFQPAMQRLEAIVRARPNYYY